MSDNPYIHDCSNCPFRCDGVSKMVYNFNSDVEFAEKIEKYVTDKINTAGLFCKKTDRDGYPDLEVYDKYGKLICYIEVKAQRRTFMSVERILPDSHLKPSETMALNLSDLLRYFDINKNAECPIFVLWALLNRKCVIQDGKIGLYYQNINRLEEIYKVAGDTRRFRRMSGQGDVVNGIHKGVVVNYHYSLNELRPFSISDLFQTLSIGVSNF